MVTRAQSCGLPDRVGLTAATPLHADGPNVVTSELQGATVLLVEDEKDLRDTTELLLQGSGAKVLCANDGAQALEILQRRSVDVILSDIAMPRVDGYELMRRVRRLERARGGNMPAVALSAQAMADQGAKALDAGYQRYLSKPVDPTILLATLALLLSRSGRLSSTP